MTPKEALEWLRHAFMNDACERDGEALAVLAQTIEQYEAAMAAVPGAFRAAADSVEARYVAARFRHELTKGNGP
jgi:hypothetical protein